MYHINRYFLNFYVLFMVIGGIFLVTGEKGDWVLYLNQFHAPHPDLLFKYLTYLGEGWTFALLVIILTVYKIRYGIIGILSLGITGGFTQLLKHIYNLPRPQAALTNHQLQFVDGMEILTHHSFPSGHAATIFAAMCLLALLARRQWIGVPLLLIAVLVALSRVYLAFHFFVDIFFGSIIGVVGCTLIYWLITYHPFFQKYLWMNYSFVHKDSDDG